MKVVLASTSPRRLEFFERWGFDFEPVRPFAKEVLFEGEPLKTILFNAYLKALSTRLYNENIVVGMDTIVSFEKKILGKPKDEHHNAKMLEELSGKSHFVLTGIAALYKGTFFIDSVQTKVTFRKLSSEEISTYVLSGEGLDKAGGYAVQGLASSFITLIDGSLDNVIGIPIFAIRELLDKII
jgi:septum formation protein